MERKNPGQLFYKLFYRYTAVVVCIVFLLAAYFIVETKTRILETNLKYRDDMADQVSDRLEDCAMSAANLHAGLYQSEGVLSDLLVYFGSSGQEYQKYRLDKYMASDGLVYAGFDNYVENYMQGDTDISSVEFISYAKSEVTICDSDGRVIKNPDAMQRMKELEAGILSSVPSVSFVKEIRDPSTMAGVGCMIVHFNNDILRNAHQYYPAAGLLVLAQNRQSVYQQIQKINLTEFLEAEQNNVLEQYLDAYLLKTETAGYVIYTYLDKFTAAYLPFTAFLAISGIGIALIVIGMMGIRSHLLHLNRRFNCIIEGMARVRKGDLTVNLPAEEKGDELDIISAHFNEMCRELDCYIKKSYLAEIEQKNAEMEALQNQIHPHFLYNTLEAIRMKAISNGDREVGKMLYSMAVIFRSQLKEKNVITLVQEIHYCKKYMELFEYRYMGKFTSHVDCPEECMTFLIMKFLLQPVVENYFIHGIRAEEPGNEIRIWAELLPDLLRIHVEDNGKGMTEEAMEEKNRKLCENHEEDKHSVGIPNVNRRIKAFYGEQYGVSLSKSKLGGLHVTVSVGKRVEENA